MLRESIITCPHCATAKLETHLYFAGEMIAVTAGRAKTCVKEVTSTS